MTSTPGGQQPPSSAAAPAAGPAAAGDAVAPAAAPRPPRRQSVRGLVLTMIVIGGFAIALWALVPRPSGLRQPVVDVPAVAAQAPAVLGFTPAVPTGLGAGWTPTSALLQDGTDGVRTWRVNYSTPAGSWVSLIQGAKATRNWEDTQIIDGAERGTADVDGRSWVVRSRPDRGLTAYVLRGPDVTTVVAGRAGPAEIELLIRATPQRAG